MQIRLSSLQHAIGLTTLCCKERSQLVPLRGILFATNEVGLTLTGNNLDQAIQVEIPLSQKTSINHGVYGRDLKPLLHLDPHQMITISAQGSKLSFQNEIFHLEVPTIPVEEFPVWKLLENIENPFNSVMQCSAEDTRKIAILAARAASRDETRYIINGVRLQKTEAAPFGVSVPIVVSTDGRRLTCIKLDANGDVTGILPTPYLQMIETAITEYPINPAMTLTRHQQEVMAVFQGADYQVKITSKLIEGSYPKWQLVIPTTSGKKCKLSLKGISKICQTLQSVKEAIWLLFEKGEIIAAAINQANECQSKIKTGIKIPEEISELRVLNPAYIQELELLYPQDVEITFYSETDPLAFEDFKKETYHILMPIRLDDREKTSQYLR